MHILCYDFITEKFAKKILFRKDENHYNTIKTLRNSQSLTWRRLYNINYFSK